MPKIAAVLLAAGASTRFGQPKQLLDWQGQSLVAHAADVAIAAGLDPVIVVLGNAAQEARATLGERPLQTVMNWRWQQGLSTSLHVGLTALPPDVDGAVFLQCDQPLVPPDLLRQLVARFGETNAPLVYPTADGHRSTPVLFSRTLFAELAAARGDEGGRSLAVRYAGQAATVEVDDPTLLTDVDTPAEYQHLLQTTASHQQPPTLLSPIRSLLIDMDGVLWRGNEAIPGLPAFFELLESRDIRYVIATNNASRLPQFYVEKLAGFGVQIPAEAILTSAQATAAYLATIAPPGTPVYVIGSEGLRQPLLDHGFALVEDGAEYVAVGLNRELTWHDLTGAALQIRAGARFIGTNPDVTFPSERGPVPGNGAILAALQAATGVAPTLIGKPEPWLYREAMRRIQAAPETTAVIGDRLDTDIAGGVRIPITTILVLSGITTVDDLARSPLKPDLVCADVAELTRWWQEGCP